MDKNSPKYQKYLERHRSYYSTDVRWGLHIKKKYGMTPKDYSDILQKQNGNCAICTGPAMAIRGRAKHTKQDRFDIDHNHQTGIVRGLLCSKCNRGLGAFNDSPELVAKALNYLINNHQPFYVITEWLQSQYRDDPDSEQW